MKTLRKKLFDAVILLSWAFPATVHAQSAHRTADKAWWIANGVSWAFSIADAENTVYSLQNPRVHELNPLLGRHPSRTRIYAIGAPITLFNSYMSYKYKREDDQYIARGMKPPKIRWYFFPLVNAGVHGVALGITIKLTGR